MIYRIDVRTTPAARGGQTAVDPVGEAVRQQIQEFGVTVGPIATSRIFLIDSDADRAQIDRAAGELLADPVVESAQVVTAAPSTNGTSRIEIHLKPGVMDPVASSTEMALRDMGLNVREVRTGRAYVIEAKIAREQLQWIASRVLANGVIEAVHFDAYIPQKFEAGRPYEFKLAYVPLRELTDEQLQKLSREGHLFLSLAEMKAVQAYFREQGREPTDIELETLAQTWSEHCVHKTLKSAVDVEVRDETGKVTGTRHYKNLIKETIFNSTMQLMKSRNDGFCLSVFVDNAGVIAFDDVDAVCFKVETHNHPSAIEPYGGSATGIGGVIRDIMGTGLAAKPVANTDVFCVAYPDVGGGASLPRGVIHPKRILQQVVAGVRDYGNRMGIPTVNGAVYFDDRYLGNPLVFCGCVGLIPRDKIEKASMPGDAIVVMGGRTGRDGIHGATFSSAELTDTHADEFSHAVQIGNAITEKKVADVLLQARDRSLFTAVTDCGAGGLSSAVGEMADRIGATVELDRVPLKYAGLRYDEIWISEAQERMVLSVPADKLDELLKLAAAEDVEATVIGEFGTSSHVLLLRYRGQQVGQLSMKFVHHGIPMPTRKAIVTELKASTGNSAVDDLAALQAAVRKHRQNPSGYENNAKRDQIYTNIELAIASGLRKQFNTEDEDEFTVNVDRSTGEITASRQGQPIPRVVVGRIGAQAVRQALPQLVRQDASIAKGAASRFTSEIAGDIKPRLLSLLAHPNIASKHWIIRQYDHEVQGGSVIKPLTGPLQVGPSDAAVVRPKLNSHRGVVVGCGLAPHIEDPYEMALAAIDEAVRNVVAVGADPAKVAILDNFCWPSVDDEKTMGTLVRACEACRDAAIAYGIPFISGKDSLHNQFTDSETGRVLRIPNTLLISAIGVIEDVRKCVTMDLKNPQDGRLLLVSPTSDRLADRIATHRALAAAIAKGLVQSCHDVSEGGYLTAVAEMCIASGYGADVALADVQGMFAETVGCYVIETDAAAVSDLQRQLVQPGTGLVEIGRVSTTARLQVGNSDKPNTSINVEELTNAWRGTLDW